MPEVATPGGLEPPTFSLEGCCSIQLSYGVDGQFKADERVPTKQTPARVVACAPGRHKIAGRSPPLPAHEGGAFQSYWKNV